MLAWLEGSDSKIEALDLAPYEAPFDERLETFFKENNYYLDEADKQDVEVMKKDAIQVIKGRLRLLDFEEVTSLTSVH